MTTSPPVEMKQVAVNVNEFVRTRDALVSAYTKLSSSIDKAVKAYIEHTDAVIAGDTPLDVSYLTQPFHELSSAAQKLLIHGAKDAAAAASPEPENGGAKKPRRKRAPREPGAPKRPITAYFLFMAEQRPLLQKELADKPLGRAAGDLAKVGTERWNALSDRKKQKYKDEYNRLRLTFVQELKAFKASGGKLTAGEEKLVQAPIEELEAHDDAHPLPTLGAEDEDDASDDDESSDSPSEDDDDEQETSKPALAAAAPAPRTSTSPDVAKKTPKSALKKTTKRDSAAMPAPPKFSAVDEPPKKFSSLDTPAAASSSSPERKRKAEAEPPKADDEPVKKRRGRPAKVKEQEAAVEGEAPVEKKKKKEKEEKKRRKSVEA